MTDKAKKPVMVDCPMCQGAGKMDNSRLTPGMRIRALRGDEDQREFAADVGLTKAQLANIESDVTPPSGPALIVIAQKCGVTVGYLRNGPVEPETAAQDAEAETAEGKASK